MAIAQSTLLSNGNTPGSVTTLTITNFTVAGADKVLYVVVFSNTTNTAWHAGCTCIWDSAGANQSFTQIGVTTGTGISGILFILKNPTDGVNKTISLAGIYNGGTDMAIASLLTGVDQTTPNDTVDIVQAATGTSKSSSTITSPSGDWIAGFIGVDTENAASLTQQGAAPAKVQNTGNNNATMGYSTDQDGVDDTLDWAWTTTSRHSLFTFNVNAAAGGAAFIAGKPVLIEQAVNRASTY